MNPTHAFHRIAVPLRLCLLVAAAASALPAALTASALPPAPSGARASGAPAAGAPAAGAPATAGPGAAAPEKFALQVGIDRYENGIPPLTGAVQDVRDMRDVLISRFGFPADRILTLTDAQATHDAIISAFRTQLIENAKRHPNAIVLFEFSGHGSQVKDTNGDEPDGLDETIVPVDSRDAAGKHFDIIDDALDELFDDLGRYTSNITFILDSCHSGTGTRGLEVAREIPTDTRPQPPQKPLPPEKKAAASTPTATRGGAGTEAEKPAALVPESERYVAIAGCLPYEKSYEKVDGPRHNGALTYYLVQALRRAKPETTYRELMAEVANAVSLNDPNQHPQIEGDIRRPVFGGTANREDPFIRILKVDGDRITIDAGMAHGVKEGTILAIYAPDARRLIGERKKIATAVVTKVSPLTATATVSGAALTAASAGAATGSGSASGAPASGSASGTATGSGSASGAATIPLAAKVVLVSPLFGSAPVRVAVASPAASRSIDPGDRPADPLSTLLKDDGLLALVPSDPAAAKRGEPAPWDVAVMRGRFGDVFKDTRNIAPPAEGEDASLPAPGDEVEYIAAHDGLPLFGFFVRPNDPKGSQKIADALRKLAQQRNLMALANQVSPLNDGIKVTVLRVAYKRDSAGRPVTDDRGGYVIDHEEPLPADQLAYHLDQGERLRLQIDNRSGKDLYITVFDLSNDGSINLFPPSGASDLLRDGASMKTSLVWKTSGPPGYETFKLLATTEQTDFSFLEQDAVTRSTLPTSPIERLIGQAIGQTRSTPEARVANLDEWGAAQVNLVISDRVR